MKRVERKIKLTFFFFFLSQPGNVLVSDNYDAKVADFGVSLAAKKGPPSKSKSAAKETSEVVRLEGTDFYMAPELFVYTSGSQQTFSLDTDVYAFGIVLYELFNRCNLLYDDLFFFFLFCEKKYSLIPLL